MTPAEMTELRELVHWYAQQTRRKALVESKVSQCDGKHQFATYNQAMETMSPRLREVSQAYRCKICNHWHIGGMGPARQRRIGYQQKRRGEL